jgi:hypothetical protein
MCVVGIENQNIIQPFDWMLFLVQCPKGSFHNTTSQICQQCPLNMYSHLHGQTSCTHCPMYHSTRKLGSHSASDCKRKLKNVEPNIPYSQ